MSGAKKGWDLAQLRTSFLADPEFDKLRSVARTRSRFAAAVGVWTMALAQAWREDSDDVADLMAGWEREAADLAAAELVVDGKLRGFDAWISRMRTRRANDAARKRGKPEDSE